MQYNNERFAETTTYVSETENLEKEVWKFCPNGCSGMSKTGLPVYIERWGGMDIKNSAGMGLAKGPNNVVYRRAVQTQEESNILRFLCSSMGGNKRVYQMVTIIDLEGVKAMDIFWNQKSIDFAKEIGRMNDGNYPESNGKTYLVNAPSLLSKVWGIIKGWIDPKTGGKVQICTGTGNIGTLYDDVCHDQLPACVGGLLKDH